MRIWPLPGLKHDRWTAVDVAESAIAEEMVLNPEADKYRLLNVGERAATQESRKVLLDRGIDTRGNLSRGWVKFWLSPSGTPDLAESVAERVDLQRALSRLSVLDRTTLLALAEYGSNQLAADALGIPRNTYRDHLHHARKNFRREWES